jgi:hypothetical protein
MLIEQRDVLKTEIICNIKQNRIQYQLYLFAFSQGDKDSRLLRLIVVARHPYCGEATQFYSVPRILEIKCSATHIEWNCPQVLV